MRVVIGFVIFLLIPFFGFSDIKNNQTELNYEAWETTVSRAEAVLLAGRASEKSLEILRDEISDCLLYTSPSPRDLSTSRMPSSA